MNPTEGCEKGWVGARGRELSIEREKGFEPSTSTLARWWQRANWPDFPANTPTGGCVAGQKHTSSGHLRVGGRVGGS